MAWGLPLNRASAGDISPKGPAFRLSFEDFAADILPDLTANDCVVVVSVEHASCRDDEVHERKRLCCAILGPAPRSMGLPLVAPAACLVLICAASDAQGGSIALPACLRARWLHRAPPSLPGEDRRRVRLVCMHFPACVQSLQGKHEGVHDHWPLQVPSNVPCAMR